MIEIQLCNSPGYPTTNPNYLGTIHHGSNGVAAGINPDYRSTLLVRRYLCGLEPANYPVPAMIGEVVVLDDSQAFEIVITDCDNAFDPRLCIAVLKRDGAVITDYPHDSPNYR